MVIQHPDDTPIGQSDGTTLLAVMRQESQPHGIVLKKGQSLFDAALQHCGNPDHARAIARLNNMEMDHVAQCDEDILIPEPEARPVRLLEEEGCVPCTGDLAAATDYTYYGLGFRRLGRMRIVPHRIDHASVLRTLVEHYNTRLLPQAERPTVGELHLLP